MSQKTAKMLCYSKAVFTIYHLIKISCNFFDNEDYALKVFYGFNGRKYTHTQLDSS